MKSIWEKKYDPTIRISNSDCKFLITSKNGCLRYKTWYFGGSITKKKIRKGFSVCKKISFVKLAILIYGASECDVTASLSSHRPLNQHYLKPLKRYHVLYNAYIMHITDVKKKANKTLKDVPAEELFSVNIRIVGLKTY